MCSARSLQGLRRAIRGGPFKIPPSLLPSGVTTVLVTPLQGGCYPLLPCLLPLTAPFMPVLGGFVSKCHVLKTKRNPLGLPPRGFQVPVFQGFFASTGGRTRTGKPVRTADFEGAYYPRKALTFQYLRFSKLRFVTLLITPQFLERGPMRGCATSHEPPWMSR